MASSFKWDDSKLRKEVDFTVHQKIEKACIMVESDAKRICPVDTGRARASISHEITKSKDEITGIVGSDVKYFVFFEYGTSKQSAQPTLRPALRKNIPKIKQLFKK